MQFECKDFQTMQFATTEIKIKKHVPIDARLEQILEKLSHLEDALSQK